VSSPLISVGIPTYDRPQLLSRALESVARQDYDNLDVIVSDNASPGTTTEEIVDSFRDRIPALRYVRQESNIGALGNIMFLLACAKGEYFMWLADDDEISDNYVSELATVMIQDPRAACAMGRWVLMIDATRGTPQRTSHYESRSATLRALRFAWSTDDMFFYALHRTSILRLASFEGYWGPNRYQTVNWAYVLLFDVVLRGRVRFVSRGSPTFIHHDYTPKSYVLPPTGFTALHLKALRRLNVHALYWRKCASTLGPAPLALLVPVSIASMTREASRKVFRALGRALHPRKRPR
jgi:glycosyltransferase involved in cell wall biosynthesis